MEKINLTGLKFGRLTVLEPKWIVKENGSKQKGWICRCECGTVKFYLTHHIKSGKTKSCGCYNREVAKARMTGENNPYWKGGKVVNRRGYMVIKHGEHRGKLEHRYVYETHYGIKLKTHQNIHHINGNRLDNHIENLELWDTSQPGGQRIEDKILYYHSLINEYKNHPEYKEFINKLLKELI
jgi:hypothetical protein